MHKIALLVILSLPLYSWAEQDAISWLNKMANAVESLNYEGTMVFMHDDRLETMHIVHAKDHKGVREKLISLTGDARELIRNEDVLTCVWPSNHFVVVARSRARTGLPATIPVNVSDLSQYYQLTISGLDRVAGHDCKRVEIKPMDQYRYGYRLCIAIDTGMLLESVMLDTQGKPIEHMMFTGFRLLKNLSATDFEPSIASENYTWHTVAAKDQESKLHPDSAWQITNMPPGFKLSENVKRAIAANPHPVQHIILTDGLASVSVFIARPDTAKEFFYGATTSSGALHAYTHFLEDHQITVVGEVPKNTVKLIGQSVVYRRDSND